VTKKPMIKNNHGNHLRRFDPRRINFRESGILVFMVLAAVLFTAITPRFLSYDSFQAILGDSAIEIVVAAGMAAVIISRQIDLSVGAILGVAAYGVGFTLASGLHPLVALGVGLTLGLIMGSINGLIITKARVPAMIATLGMASVYRGVLFLLAPRLLGYIVNPSQIPAGFRLLSSIRILGIPYLAVFALILAAVVGFLLANTRWGRNLYAIGSNPQAARFAGIKSDTEIFKAMVLIGALSGFGGFLYVMRYANVYVRTGSGLEFSVIAGVVVGGIAIFGGSGRVFGAVLGVLLLNMFGRGFVLMNIPEFWKDVATGIAIIGAIMTDLALARRRERLLRWGRRPHIVLGEESTSDA
jgi:rhamnose transport system permease protein